MRHKRSAWARLTVFSYLAPLFLLLASCTFPTNASSSPSGGLAGGKDPASIHIGFVVATQSQNFAQEMMAGAQYAANQFHVTAQIEAPPAVDGPAEVRLFQDLTRTAKDGIAVMTLSPNLFVQPEATAVSQGIPVIAVDTVPFKGSNITTYVGNDNLAAGALLADAAIERIPPGARGSVLLADPQIGIPVLDYRVEGMKEEFQKLRPNLQVIAPIQTQLLPQQNLPTWQNIIDTHSNIVACLGAGDADGVSLAQIKQASHNTYLSGAFDLTDAALQAVANGTNFALLDPEHFLKGYVAMRLLIEYALQGKALPQQWWNPGALLVTQTNVQDIITRQTSFAAKIQFYQPIIDREFANPAAQMKPLSEAK